MKLFNTMTRTKQELVPLEDKTVKFYSCGLTVYSQPHIGNWVGYIYWDVLKRVLETEGYKVKHIQNITDVGHLVSDDDDGEDKMEKGARAEGKTAWEVADKYIAIANDEAFKLLNLMRPELVRATETIEAQIDFVKLLEQKDLTYIIPNEGVYFDTSKLTDYGKLAQLDISGLKAGVRVAVEGKHNPTDFAVWKFSPNGQKRDMEWDSPWGKGFPGWHLECSVIARQGLGDQLDIHAGGIDHIPVHHTNEIAQSESLTGKPLANVWLHNNHLKINGTKIAKSLGNVITLEDVISKGFDVDAFKLMVLSKNYRTEGNFTWDILDAAQNRLNNWRMMADLNYQLQKYQSEDVERELITALADDLDTPKALMIIDEYFSKCLIQNLAPGNIISEIETLFGIKLDNDDLNPEQKQLVAQRALAREVKDWGKSDRLRDDLNDLGIAVKDTQNGQTWHRI